MMWAAETRAGRRGPTSCLILPDTVGYGRSIALCLEAMMAQSATEGVRKNDAGLLERELLQAYGANRSLLASAAGAAWTEFFMDFFSQPRFVADYGGRSICKARSRDVKEEFSNVQAGQRSGCEFLWDLCCFPDWKFKPGTYSHPIGQPLPLVLESESGDASNATSNANEVYYDFAKILFARAETKVMIFGFHRKQESRFEEMVLKMQKDVIASQDLHSQYLFVGVMWGWRDDHPKDGDLRTLCWQASAGVTYLGV